MLTALNILSAIVITRETHTTMLHAITAECSVVQIAYLIRRLYGLMLLENRPLSQKTIIYNVSVGSPAKCATGNPAFYELVGPQYCTLCCNVATIGCAI